VSSFNCSASANEARQEQKAFAARVDEPQLSEVALSQIFSRPENGRLAVLGDSLIRLCVSEHLVIKHPQFPESALGYA
jgi:dsRNA-specific ribonuclease